MNDIIVSTDLPGIPLFRRGKVRDVYDLGDRLLIIATDRISAYDCVMQSGIPGKGKILTTMSLFWFEMMEGLVPNHIVDASPEGVGRFGDWLVGRSMIVRKAERCDLECVVRGYLSGSGWREYKEDGRICGVELPVGLRESDRLPKPVFTPATKAESGHDENVTFENACAIVGDDMAHELKRLSIAVYEKARDHAEARGIIIADTKFEFGMIDGRMSLIDEMLSPDSSRFWPMADYAPGRSQNSFDKQFLRDYLDSTGWDHTPPAPLLPDYVVEKTREKYQEACDRLVIGEGHRP